MKAIVGLLFGICLTIVAVYLATTKQIETSVTVVLLTFAILGGLAVANFDLIKSIKWKDVEVTTYAERVEEIKSDALQEIEASVRGHKESIRLLMTSLNDTRQTIEVQRKAVESLIDRVSEQETNLARLASDANSARVQIETLHAASSDLALLLSKITWLQTVTKNEFGTRRATKAAQDIVDELNRIVTIVIPDPLAREEWIRQLNASLPARS